MAARRAAVHPREAAGEVQTPLVGPGADDLRIGDRVWFRHAKAGEVSEHVNEVHLVEGSEKVATVQTYRGEQVAFLWARINLGRASTYYASLVPRHSRQHDRLRPLYGAGLALLTGVALAVATPGTWAGAQSRPLSPRFALTGYLGVEQAGNTLLTCPDGSAAGGEPCAAAQGGGMVGNDGYPMAFVDTDGVAGTFDSSSAQVVAPPGAGIAFAGLYWGGDAGTGNAAGTTGCRSAASANRVTPPPAPGRANQVLVDVGGKGYVGVPAGTFDMLPSSLGGATFQGFADLTRLFARYSGLTTPTAVPVTVANVQLAQGPNCSGGWSLLLVYAYPDGPDPTYAPAYRSVAILDGLVAVTPGTPVSATADGFRAATDGAPLGGELGVVLYDGDRGTAGDQVSVDGAAIGTDVADSTVTGSGYGVALDPVGPRSPAYGNSLGYDSQVLDLPAGTLKPGATSAVTTLSSTDDAMAVGALVLVSRVDPLLAIAQTVTRLPDGSAAGYADLVSGDRVRLTLRLRALAPVTAVTVAATPAPGLAPVAGSLTLDGAPVAPAGGELSATGARLALAGLAHGATAVVAYDVMVGAGASPGVPLASHATVRYSAGGDALVGYAPPVAVLANRVDLALTQTTNTRTVTPGHPAVLTVAVTNQGKVPATGVAVADPLPAGLALVRADAAQGSYDQASGAWSIGALAPGAAVVLRLTVAPAGVAAPASPAPPVAAQSSARPPSAPPPSSTAATPSGAAVAVMVTQTAEISGADQLDVDSLAGDGLAGEDDIAAVTLTVTAPAAAGTTPDSGVQARTTRPPELSFDTVVTVAAALVGAALILIGAMVFVSARRR